MLPPESTAGVTVITFRPNERGNGEDTDAPGSGFETVTFKSEDNELLTVITVLK